MLSLDKRLKINGYKISRIKYIALNSIRYVLYVRMSCIAGYKRLATALILASTHCSFLRTPDPGDLDNLLPGSGKKKKNYVVILN